MDYLICFNLANPNAGGRETAMDTGMERLSGRLIYDNQIEMGLGR